MSRNVKWFRVGLCAAMMAWFQCPTAAVPIEGAQRVFADYKDSVLQIRILDRTSGTKASIGSGFWVTSQGHIISNFHVIAGLVNDPDQYRAEYVLNDGTTGFLKLVDIDVVHDLALLKAPELEAKYLGISTNDPEKGERLFSLGNPHDLGLTIVEGTFNGFLEKSLYKKVHFTGSINPGMSGGPTINREGKVVGINVATAGNQVSFLVPATYVAKLLERGTQRTDEIKDFATVVRDQLIANQDQYMSSLLTQPFVARELRDFVVPGRLAQFLNCWGDTQQGENKPYTRVYYTCATQDDIFLSRRQHSGIIRFRHDLYTTDELGPVRFYNLLEEQFHAKRLRLRSDEEMVTNYQCKSGFADHNGTDSKVVFCLRAYKKFPGLYDAFITATSLASEDEAVRITIALGGVSYENAVRFPQAFFEVMAWKE